MQLRAVWTLTLVLMACGLTGCGVGQITTQPAPNAADPLCAQVVLALPAFLGSQELLTTTAQATAAWGNPTAPIVLHCGVEPPGPTTESCTTVSDSEGIAVDWISRAEPDRWVFTTYGINPAVQLVVPQAAAADGTEHLIQLGPALSQIPVSRNCL